VAILGQPFQNRRGNVVNIYNQHVGDVFNLLDWYYDNIATGDPVKDAQKAADYLGLEPGTFNSIMWRKRGTPDMIRIDDIAIAAGLYDIYSGNSPTKDDDWNLTRIAVIVQFIGSVD